MADGSAPRTGKRTMQPRTLLLATVAMLASASAAQAQAVAPLKIGYINSAPILGSSRSDRCARPGRPVPPKLTVRSSAHVAGPPGADGGLRAPAADALRDSEDAAAGRDPAAAAGVPDARRRDGVGGRQEAAGAGPADHG